MRDFEFVLPPVAVSEHTNCHNLELTRTILHRDGREPYIAQRRQESRRRPLTLFLRKQAAMHRHGLRAVLAQVHRIEASVPSQRVVGTPVRATRGLKSRRVPRDDAFEQAHRSAVRNQVANGGSHHSRSNPQVIEIEPVIGRQPRVMRKPVSESLHNLDDHRGTLRTGNKQGIREFLEVQVIASAATI